MGRQGSSLRSCRPPARLPMLLFHSPSVCYTSALLALIGFFMCFMPSQILPVYTS